MPYDPVEVNKLLAEAREDEHLAEVHAAANQRGDQSIDTATFYYTRATNLRLRAYEIQTR